MGKIHVLPERVANQIAAGEVVERPASVVKELLENALDAGSTRIRIQVEAGGKKLIQITDNGCGMVRDDAMLAFERHATSKIKDTEDLLSISTLGFRGEALPSIASVARLHLETRAEEEAAGTVLEINGGKIIRVEEAGLPLGTSITIRDLFFNTPARKKFLRSESTELSHIVSLVTHYALAHPEKHFELHSATNALLVAPPVAGHRERVYQVFGRETLDQLIPLAAVQPLERIGLPQPPPWRRSAENVVSESAELADEATRAGAPAPHDFGEVRLHGFVSKPEIQKLNRNSIFIFVNGRLIRDRLIQHGITEAYRNILAPTVFPVVLLFIEMPTAEVDVNVHPSKTEVRFRQQTVIHDFVRESVRAALMKARPVPQFLTEIGAQPTASPGLTSPGVTNRQEREPRGGMVRTRGPVARLVRASGSGRLRAAGTGSSPGDRTACIRRRDCSRGQRGGIARARAGGDDASAGDRSSANSRSRLRAADSAGGADSANARVAANPAAPWPDSKFIHSCRQRRRPLDHRSTCGPRACTVRASAAATFGAAGREPAFAHAAGHRTHSGTAGDLQRHCRGTCPQRF